MFILKNSLNNHIISCVILLMTGCGGGNAITKENSVTSIQNNTRVSTVSFISQASVPLLIDTIETKEQILISKKINEIEQALASRIPNSYIIRADSEPYKSAFSQAVKEYDDLYTKKSSSLTAKEASDAIKLAAANFVYDETPKFDSMAKNDIKRNDTSHYIVVRMPAAKIKLYNQIPSQVTDFNLQVKVFAAKTDKMIWIYNASIKSGVKSAAEAVAEAIANRMKIDGIFISA